MTETPIAAPFTVQQPAFSGPLDLLLRLIERRELDITAVSLAQIADEYLAYVRQLSDPDPLALSEFLVIAARLLLIKSRALLPQLPTHADQRAADDVAAELASQLREYQRYKQAATLLRAWEEQARRCFLRTAPPTVPTPTPTHLQATVCDLLHALKRRLQLRAPLEEPPLPLLVPRLLTVAEVAQTIRTRLQRQAWIDFVDLLDLDANRVAVVVAFWATLELLKRREIVAEQDCLFGAIALGRGPAFGNQQVDHDGSGAGLSRQFLLNQYDAETLI